MEQYSKLFFSFFFFFQSKGMKKMFLSGSTLFETALIFSENANVGL